MSDQVQGNKLGKQRLSLIVLAACVAVILLATFMGSWIQTAGFRYEVEDLRGATNKGSVERTTYNDTKDVLDADGNPVLGEDGKPLQEPDIQTKTYTVNGKVTSGILFRPKKAEDDSRPAVVFSHGWYNNREMQLQNAIELVRRGYVVLVIDQPGHGHNEDGTAANTNTMMGFYGSTMYDCVKYLYNLPEVDPAKIAVSGHSMGGAATTNAMSSDAVTDTNQKDANFAAGKNLGLISAGLVQANSPASSVGKNIIATGLVKGNADEFFFSCTIKEKTYIPQASGRVTEDNYDSVDAEGNAVYYVKKGKDYVPATKYNKNTQYYAYTTSATSNWYMEGSAAYNFTRSLGLSGSKLNAYMADIADWTTVNGGIYANGELIAQPDGRKLVSTSRKGEALASADNSIRAIYEAKETHPMNHWSTKTAAHVIDFFYNAYGVVEGFNYKAPTNQTWWLKEAFAGLALIALFVMLIPILDLLLQSKLFESLKGEPAEAPILLTRPRKHVSYWISGIASTIFGAVSFKNLVAEGKWYNALGLNEILDNRANGFIYENIGKIAAWGMMCAAFSLIFTAVVWLVNHAINAVKYGDEAHLYDEHPFDGFQIRSVGNIVKTLAAAAILVGIFFGTTTAIWQQTQVQFAVWTFGVRVFDFVRIGSMIKYVPYFFIYYVVMAAMSQGYRVKDLPEWATIAINACFNVIGFTIMVWSANNHYINVGAMMHASNNMNFIHAVPMIPTIILATVVSRRMYVRTGNAWLAGLVNATIMTFIACANTSVVGAVAWEYPVA